MDGGRGNEIEVLMIKYSCRKWFCWVMVKVLKGEEMVVKLEGEGWGWGMDSVGDHDSGMMIEGCWKRMGVEDHWPKMVKGNGNWSFDFLAVKMMLGFLVGWRLGDGSVLRLGGMDFGLIMPPASSVPNPLYTEENNWRWECRQFWLEGYKKNYTDWSLSEWLKTFSPEKFVRDVEALEDSEKSDLCFGCRKNEGWGGLW